MRQHCFSIVFCVLAAIVAHANGQSPAVAGETPKPATSPASSEPLAAELLSVKRIYVAQLSGGPPADALRELIISSLNATRLFILTDNPDRADAVLKGAADEHAFEDIFDHQDGLGARTGGGAKTGGLLKSTGAFGSVGITDNEARHTRERKHEAYAAVRLCNHDGDVLWSTTEESQGGKFRGAGADVAAKVARDLTFALERTNRAASTTR
ncbi:MAG TPA: hypothetical protein VLJ11_18685 [Bryobacteraceae bacterium]|nr:hypothetical protein [Bryobacteraceae bacterium]